MYSPVLPGKERRSVGVALIFATAVTDEKREVHNPHSVIKDHKLTLVGNPQ